MAFANFHGVNTSVVADFKPWTLNVGQEEMYDGWALASSEPAPACRWSSGFVVTKEQRTRHIRPAEEPLAWGRGFQVFGSFLLAVSTHVVCVNRGFTYSTSG